MVSTREHGGLLPIDYMFAGLLNERDIHNAERVRAIGTATSKVRLLESHKQLGMEHRGQHLVRKDRRKRGKDNGLEIVKRRGAADDLYTDLDEDDSGASKIYEVDDVSCRITLLP